MGVYVPPTLTVDAIIFQLQNDKLHILLLQRARAPFKGNWALPGGYNPEGETTRQALGRILKAKTGVDIETQLGVLEQLYTFDDVGRDPRGHAIAVAYMGVGRDIHPGGSDTQNPVFFPVDGLPKLAYDHSEIISYALKRLQMRVLQTNIVFAMLPPVFTFSQLQTAYEAVLLRPLDKRNFRKRILNLGLVRETGLVEKSGAHRPARLYEFVQRSLRDIVDPLA